MSEPLNATTSDPKARGVMAGFPPSADRTLRFADGTSGGFPNHRWSFSHRRELSPSAAVRRGPGAAATLPYALRDDLDAVAFNTQDGQAMTWGQSVDVNFTDGLIVLHRGQVVYETYRGALEPHIPHLAMSVTKSFVGICIDDIERRNDTLALKEILGLVSQLKEEKNCKVVLLLNDEQLGGSSKEFQAYLEKVADVFIRFEPTPFEAARIALDGSMTYHSKLEELCIRLGLVNIRTIQKIDGTLRRISAELVGIDQRVIEQAAHSTTLFWFSQLHPEDAPTIDYIRSTNIWEEILAKDDKPVTHPEWRALLTSYEFADLDEFDILLLDGIQRGHFDFTALKSQALRQADLLSLRDEDDSFSQAWRLYHDSFDDNSDQVMTKLAEAVIKTPRVVSATNLSGTVGLLRDLNWQGNIKNLIETYVNGRDDSLDFWDLSRHPFGGDVKDQDVVEAFRKKRNSFPDKKDFARILIKWGEKSGYNNDDISFIASHSEHDFHALFRRLRGTELRRAIEGSLWFKESNEREEMVIVAAATSALRKIASESAINRRRVLRYQISLD